MYRRMNIVVVGFILTIFIIGLPSNAAAERVMIGRWIDKTYYIDSIIEIYTENGKPYIYQKFKDGSGESRLVIKDTTSIGKATFRIIDSATGDHYVINKNNYLEVRDMAGLIYTARPIK